jgi:transcriptional regulator with XRE-family HTH domain
MKGDSGGAPPVYRIELGRRIRARRAERKWSLRGAARRANVNPTYLGQVERAERDVGVATLLKIAKGLDLEAADLLRGIKLP